MKLVFFGVFVFYNVLIFVFVDFEMLLAGAHLSVFLQFEKERFPYLVSVLFLYFYLLLVEPAVALVCFLLLFNFDNLVQKVHRVGVRRLGFPIGVELNELVTHKHFVP